jgi:acetyltransferase
LVLNGTTVKDAGLVSAKSHGYPVQWARVATTRDNVTYRVRPICADDAQRERAFIMGLSAESRYSRMMFTMGDPSPGLVGQFVQVDYHETMAFVAVIGHADDELIIGVARYAANGQENYEFAVSVADEWQARGIGATLSDLLFDYARAEGIRVLHAQILATNHRMIELARWLGMTFRFTPGDGTIVKALKVL